MGSGLAFIPGRRPPSAHILLGLYRAGTRAAHCRCWSAWQRCRQLWSTMESGDVWLNLAVAVALIALIMLPQLLFRVPADRDDDKKRNWRNFVEDFWDLAGQLGA